MKYFKNLSLLEILILLACAIYVSFENLMVGQDNIPQLMTFFVFISCLY